MKIITFFNNKGGVGKTTSVYHTAWMLSEMGIKTIAVDLDPQSNLTSMFLENDRLEEIYENEKPYTILDALEPIINGEPSIPAHLEKITEDLSLILGNLALSAFEDRLSDAWLKCLNGDNYSFNITSIFKTIIAEAAARVNAAYVLIDVGPNLGAINRAVTISSDFIVMPVASDMFSLQGIKNLGLTLSRWKKEWDQRKLYMPKKLSIAIPDNKTKPIGYIVMQYSAKESKPVKAYLKWANRIPSYYKKFVLNSDNNSEDENNQMIVEDDENCIFLLKHFRSLAPMSMESHKPIFLLKPSDGAIGAHLYAVRNSYVEFKTLTEKIIERTQ